MEVDLVVTLELQPTKIEVITNIKIIYDVVDVSNGAKGFVHV
jgi:hypothetical protein